VVCVRLATKVTGITQTPVTSERFPPHQLAELLPHLLIPTVKIDHIPMVSLLAISWHNAVM